MRRTLLGIWRRYEQCLAQRPVPTQMATSAVLWGFGDYLAQTVGEQRQAKDLDLRRTLLTAGFGVGFMGPVGHFWYLNLDRACQKMFNPAGRVFLPAKVIGDSFVMGPLYVVAFYAYGCAVIDGSGYSGFRDKLKKDFAPTFAAELAIWPVFQAFNFWKVPLQHQLLAVNCMTLVDASFLSWARAQDDWVATVKGCLGLQEALAAENKVAVASAAGVGKSLE